MICRYFRYRKLKKIRKMKKENRFRRFMSKKKFYNLLDIGILIGIINNVHDVIQLSKTEKYINLSKKYRICPLCKCKLKRFDLLWGSEAGYRIIPQYYYCINKNCDFKLKYIGKDNI